MPLKLSSLPPIRAAEHRNQYPPDQPNMMYPAITVDMRDAGAVPFGSVATGAIAASDHAIHQPDLSSFSQWPLSPFQRVLIPDLTFGHGTS